MTSIGPQLKTARERSGITAADAAKRLHMRSMFIEALEREEWDTVGAPVYVRGFLRNYARMLGLDAQSVVEEFNTVVGFDRQAADEEAAAYEPRASVDFRDRRRFRYPGLLMAMSIVAAMLVARVVWTIATPSAPGHNEVRSPQAAAMTTVAVPTLGAAASPSTARGVDLRLELTQPCWLSIFVDGKRVVYDTLPAGTVKEFHGVREISLRAGNAGGVVATIDGQALGTLGSPGQVQDRVFAVKTPPAGQNGVHE